MNRLFLSLFALILFPVQAGLFGDDDLLPVDKAFVLSAGEAVTDTLQVKWAITEGYYLYRSKLAFESKTDGVSLGEPVLPQGKTKHDEFFGDVETYRGNIQVSVPVIRDDPSVSRAMIQISSQGCADRGICYPPQKQMVEIRLPAAEVAPGQLGFLSNSKKPGSGLGFGFGDDELLDADEAFGIEVDVKNANTLTARWSIAQGYYLYRDKLAFASDSDKISLLPASIPAGEIKQDEAFGDVAVFHQQVEATIPVTRHDRTESNVAVTFTFQGCEENRGVCYPPIKKTFNLFLPAAEAATRTTATPVATETAPDLAIALSEQDTIANRLASGNTLATLLAFFGFGLLLAFTPCVFPMIPILSSIIVGQGERMTARRGFILSVVYVLAMAVTYAIAGVIAGMFGENLQAAFQNPWVLGTFAAVFALLSLSMFGFFQLQMPAALQNKLSTISNEQQGGNLFGVAIMGFLSALIVGPCVAAPLAGALIYIGQTGDAVLGGMALFALSLGMGAPLIAIGTGAGKLLPKAGAWMDAVKAVFGVMLLGVAIWMLERILPGPVSLLLWALLLITSAIYMGAIEPVPQGASGWKKLWKGIGLVGLVYGTLLLIGAASGGNDPLRPLEKLSFSGSNSGLTTQSNHMVFQTIKSEADLDRELAIARSQGQAAMLDFYADWCVSCKELEKYTFSDSQVVQATSKIRLLQADVTANDGVDKALMKRFQIIGPPSIIFYDAQGEERRDLRLVGFKKAADFIAHVGKL